MALFSGMLFVGPVISWIIALTRRKVYPYAWTDCKFAYFIFYFFQHFSSALLVIMSVEKFLVLYLPLKTKRICTVKIAKRVVSITALLYISFESQFFFVIDAHTKNGKINCVFVRVSESYPLILNRIDSVLYSFGPFIIMTVTNCAIIYKFLIATCKNSGSGTESTNQALSKSAIRGCLMLVTVSVTFIILTGPVSVIYFITKSPDPILTANIYVLADLNHAINAALYCVVGSRFRREVLDVLCCRKMKRSNSMSASQSRSSRYSSQTIVSNSTCRNAQATASPI